MERNKKTVLTPEWAAFIAELADGHISGNPANLLRSTCAGRAVVLGLLYPASEIQGYIG